MNSFDKIYEPYNFSETRCYTIQLEVTKEGFMKIEHKLPSFIKELRGVFVSTTCVDSQGHLSGLLSMNFNGQAFKSFQCFVYKNNHLEDCSHPFPFKDTIMPNSFLQGFYYDFTNSLNLPYKLTVYIHYTNKEFK